MSLDDFLDREFHPKTYTCGHFAAEVWKDETGEDISEIVVGFVEGSENANKAMRARKRLQKPVTPCICLMRAKDSPTHVGVYIDGFIFHLDEAGAIFERLKDFTDEYRLSFYQ